MKKKIYISGKINGLPAIYSQMLFERAEKFLAENGYEPVNPWKIDKAGCKHFDDYLMADLEELRKCDGIYMLANWRVSNGSHVEYYFAKGMKDEGKPMEIIFESACETCRYYTGDKRCKSRNMFFIERTDTCDNYENK